MQSELCTPTTTESRDNRTGSSPRKKDIWTMTHSFYAVMGGFEFVNKADGTTALERLSGGRIISPEGLLSLKQKSFMWPPPVDIKDIKDKSKVSYATKAFILFQGMSPKYA